MSQEFLTQVSETKIRTAYLKFMVDVAEILGADKNQALKELNEVLMLKIKLAKVRVRQHQFTKTTLYGFLLLTRYA